MVPDEVKQLYGDKPRAIPVMLPVEDESLFMRQYYGCYGSNQRLKCQGDGETAERRDDKNKLQQIACPSPSNCDFGKQFKCSARIDLMVVLPDVNCGGVYQLSSGSVTTDIDLRSGIEMARHLFGRISWVPMTLKREEKKIPDPVTGKMMPHWPVSLYPQANVAEVNQIRQDTGRILERQERFAIPEPVIEGEFTREPEQAPETENHDEPQGVDDMLRMIVEATSEQELNKLFASNSTAINLLDNKVKAQLIDAKMKKADELNQRAA